MYLRIKKCAELQIVSARFSSLYWLNLFITSMLAIILGIVKYDHAFKTAG